MQVKKFEAPTMQDALNVVKRELGPTAIILSTRQNKKGFGLMSRGSVEVTAAVAESELKKKRAAEKMLPDNVKEKLWNQPADRQSQVYNRYHDHQTNLSAAKIQKRPSKPVTPKAKNAVRSYNHAFSMNAEEESYAGAQTAAGSPAMSGMTNSALMQAKGTNLNVLDTSDFLEENTAPPMISVTSRRYADIEDDDQDAERVTVPVTTDMEAPSQPARMMFDDNEIEVDDRRFDLSKQNFKTVEQLQSEVSELKTMVNDISQHAASANSYGQASSDDYEEAMYDLIAAGVQRKYAQELILKAKNRIAPNSNISVAEVQDVLADTIMRDIQTEDPLAGIEKQGDVSETKLLTLVGPTGVGKTTTIAKIASQALLEKNLRVGLINFDTYKVAAAEHLATYARIMNVPFRSASNAAELQQALFDFGSLDLVLIDTTGRSQKDVENLEQMQSALQSLPNLKTLIALSATTRDSDMFDVVNRFKMFKPEGLVFSKLDETGSYGCLYNVARKTGLPLIYFTTGQRVPEDIERATKERVAALLFNF